jgi:hypothetical protein
MWKERNHKILKIIRETRASWRERVKDDLLFLRFRVPQNLIDNIYNLIDMI